MVARNSLLALGGAKFSLDLAAVGNLGTEAAVERIGLALFLLELLGEGGGFIAEAQ